jgi:hypothetical protein
MYIFPDLYEQQITTTFSSGVIDMIFTTDKNHCNGNYHRYLPRQKERMNISNNTGSKYPMNLDFFFSFAVCLSITDTVS